MPATDSAAPLTPLAAALAYAERGWPISPWTANKRPLTEHGFKDATTDPAQIGDWWRRWPDALPGAETGERSGLVVIDIDVRADFSGFDTLEEIGVATHPETMTSHSPSGGCHLFFRWPGSFVKTIAGRLGRGIDIRGDGGSVLLPPGPGRHWDDVLGLDAPILPLPSWAIIREEPRKAPPTPAYRPGLSRYAEAALDDAIKRITTAPAGEQEVVLNRECYSLGQLAGAGAIPVGLVLEALQWAASRMPSHDPGRPWRAVDLERKVRDSVADGLAHPREVRRG
jgi:putative DNA primase/helicase